VEYLETDLFAVMQNQCISSLYMQKGNRHGHCPSLKMIINEVSTIFGIVFSPIEGLCDEIYS
jgi:hypothetical protein